MKWTTALPLVLLAGCASTLADTGRSPGPAMSAGIRDAIGDRFAGRPVQEMLARYGAPERQTQLAGETIYTWTATETTYYRTQPPMVTTCQLDAYVTAQLVVRTIGLSGQNACVPRFAP